ncbi:hypothetical protein IG193_08640 [Infirmifilum lucidum]|uniref:DUF5679 domain-containing protein n=1 Tax=Infirmifilum lucidum TaxID=2776706 RepID=A0A7L9FG70_9CREN|nr:DUF5679 domain-containing protein [Infirmifilum lucidum]QOJ78800.1 hypothetical protein IG193_08640 [Infirmifilum lucidum]
MSQPKVTTYCVKCRKHMEVKNPQLMILKNGRQAYKGGVRAVLERCPTG